MTHCLFPPLPDNDMEVTEDQLKGGEWQNISWLPFHLNTSIKAHRGWVSGVASTRDRDLLGFMQQMKLNVYSFGDKLNPWPDTSQLKILHVRYITLQELISTTNSQLHSLHPALQAQCLPTTKSVWQSNSRAASLRSVRQAIAQTLSAHNAFITAPSWHTAWNSQILLIRINYWHLSVHWCPE